MGLSRKSRRCRDAGGLREAGGRRREAYEALREVQLPRVVPSSIVVLVTLCNVGGRDGELCVDLVQRVLRGGQAELALEQEGFRGIAVGAGEIESLGRVDELLGLLHDAREVGEHGVFCRSAAHDDAWEDGESLARGQRRVEVRMQRAG